MNAFTRCVYLMALILIEEVVKLIVYKKKTHK